MGMTEADMAYWAERTAYARQAHLGGPGQPRSNANYAAAGVAAALATVRQAKKRVRKGVPPVEAGRQAGIAIQLAIGLMFWLPFYLTTLLFPIVMAVTPYFYESQVGLDTGFGISPQQPGFMDYVGAPFSGNGVGIDWLIIVALGAFNFWWSTKVLKGFLWNIFKVPHEWTDEQARWAEPTRIGVNLLKWFLLQVLVHGAAWWIAFLIP